MLGSALMYFIYNTVKGFLLDLIIFVFLRISALNYYFSLVS